MKKEKRVYRESQKVVKKKESFATIIIPLDQLDYILELSKHYRSVFARKIKRESSLWGGYVKSDANIDRMAINSFLLEIERTLTGDRDIKANRK